MFSVTLITGTSMKCWCTMPMPSSIAFDGRVDLDGLSVHEHLALVGVVEPIEDRHQGRLAGAVLPQQGVHLTAAQVEVDPVVGHDRAEPLRYSS